MDNSVLKQAPVGVAPAAAVEVNRPYQLARSPWVTGLTLIAGITYATTLGLSTYLIVQLIVSNTQNLPQVSLDLANFQIEGLAEFVSVVLERVWTDVNGLIIAFLVAEYTLNIMEFIGHRRGSLRGWTIPLILLPLGRTVRALIMELACLCVLTPKMFGYLGYIIAAPILEKVGVPVGRLVDSFDQVWEWLEHMLRMLYNALHFTKIERGADALTVWFNRFLLLWLLHQSDE